MGLLNVSLDKSFDCGPLLYTYKHLNRRFNYKRNNSNNIVLVLYVRVCIVKAEPIELMGRLSRQFTASSLFLRVLYLLGVLGVFI